MHMVRHVCLHFETQNQSRLKKMMTWLHSNCSAPDANLSAAGGSLATNIKDEVMVDWNAVNGPVVADQQSAAYLSTMLIAVAV